MEPVFWLMRFGCTKTQRQKTGLCGLKESCCTYSYMLNKNTQGAKKSEAKSEAPVSSYSYMRLKSVISGGGQGPSCLLATMYGQLHIN